MEKVLPNLSETTYQRGAPLEDAPTKTDCLTSIYYLFKAAFGQELPVTLIGNMPRKLADYGWAYHYIDAPQLEAGDVIFIKKRNRPRLISHAALVVKVDSVFHCQMGKGMVQESVATLFETYEQQLFEDQLLYIDYRDGALREQHQGSFIRVDSYVKKD